MKIILASESPRRLELLKHKFDVETDSVKVEEKLTGCPSRAVMRVALCKLKQIARRRPFDVILAADTTVYYKKKHYGKPRNKCEAEKFLTELGGVWHSVYTGVALAYRGKTRSFYGKSDVKLIRMSAEQIADYISGGSPMDKAGAYGVQDGVVEAFKGSYDNIVGLPTELVQDNINRLLADTGD